MQMDDGGIMGPCRFTHGHAGKCEPGYFTPPSEPEQQKEPKT